VLLSPTRSSFQNAAATDIGRKARDRQDRNTPSAKRLRTLGRHHGALSVSRDAEKAADALSVSSGLRTCSQSPRMRSRIPRSRSVVKLSTLISAKPSLHPDQTAPRGHFQRLSPARDAELFEQMAEVRFDRALADAEGVPDFLVALAVGHQAQRR
jgi:hypothetical protein